MRTDGDATDAGLVYMLPSLVGEMRSRDVASGGQVILVLPPLIGEMRTCSARPAASASASCYPS